MKAVNADWRRAQGLATPVRHVLPALLDFCGTQQSDAL